MKWLNRSEFDEVAETHRARLLTQTLFVVHRRAASSRSWPTTFASWPRLSYCFSSLF
jgi:hypothetical protein